MKRLLFISIIGLFAASCQPAEVTCDCSGTGGGLFLIDTNLTGHWKQINVNNPISSNYWNNGQIDLHFFADGTWEIDGVSGNNVLSSDAGTYKIHSNTCIDIGSRVFNYTINNGVLTFSPVPGQDYIWALYYDDGSVVTPLNGFNSNELAEINNLTKQ